MDKNSHKFLQQNTNSLAKHCKQSFMSLAMPYMIRVFIRSSSLITKRGTQLLVSLLQHLPKVRLHYRGVCAKVFQ
jgi:hypothetical protein